MENLVKDTAKKLNLTYKELGELIGYSESALKAASSSGNISEQLTKSLELLLKNQELQLQNNEFIELKATIKKFISSL